VATILMIPRHQARYCRVISRDYHSVQEKCSCLTSSRPGEPGRRRQEAEKRGDKTLRRFSGPHVPYLQVSFLSLQQRVPKRGTGRMSTLRGGAADSRRIQHRTIQVGQSASQTFNQWLYRALASRACFGP